MDSQCMDSIYNQECTKVQTNMISLSLPSLSITNSFHTNNSPRGITQQTDLVEDAAEKVTLFPPIYLSYHCVSGSSLNLRSIWVETEDTGFKLLRIV